eukprot:1158233-Pelagomonas_calceolata.AAC.12
MSAVARLLCRVLTCKEQECVDNRRLWVQKRRMLMCTYQQDNQDKSRRSVPGGASTKDADLHTLMGDGNNRIKIPVS